MFPGGGISKSRACYSGKSAPSPDSSTRYEIPETSQFWRAVTHDFPPGPIVAFNPTEAKDGSAGSCHCLEL